MKILKGFNIAMLVCDGFEEVEMTKPRSDLEKRGAKVDLIVPNANKVKSWRHDHWGKEYKTDLSLEKANPKKYDALILPGGVLNPDKLRTNKSAIKFINYFLKNKKLIAAICHGPWTLIETRKLKGRKMTSYHSIKTDIMNAGATWQNKKVVVDGLLITSRSPSDIPAFVRAISKVLEKSLK